MADQAIIDGETVGAKRNVTILSMVGKNIKTEAGRVGRAVHINTAGNIVGQMEDDAADVTVTYAAGKFADRWKSITSATAVGLIQF